MKVRVAVASAIEALISNPLRSLLTMLGIIIGVASVMVMMSIGEGARAEIDRQLATAGSNLLNVFPGNMQRSGRSMGFGGGTPFTEADIEAVQTDLPFVKAVTGVLSNQVTAVSDQANWATSIEGGTAAFFEVNNWKISEGRFFTEAESRGGAAVAVVGSSIVKNLFPNSDALGQRIRVNSVPMTIIGIMETKGGSSGGPMGRDNDDIIIAPLSMVRNRITGGDRRVARHVSRLQILVEDSYKATEVQEEVAQLLRERRRLQPGAEDNFRIINFADFIRQRSEAQATMSMLLAFTALVSLVVGGVGVMNIMLVSVTERTREIGLRMAIGARGGDILTQFLVEAIALCGLGGLIGMVLGWAGAFAFAQFGGWPMSVSPVIVGTALGASVAVGLIFGFFPARRAAQLDPIQALRHD
jgi:putative ABC transport system permease protein